MNVELESGLSDSNFRTSRQKRIREENNGDFCDSSDRNQKIHRNYSSPGKIPVQNYRVEDNHVDVVGCDNMTDTSASSRSRNSNSTKKLSSAESAQKKTNISAPLKSPIVISDISAGSLFNKMVCSNGKNPLMTIIN